MQSTSAPSSVADVEKVFFDSLIAPDIKSLEILLADDFLMIDLSGSELDRGALIASVASGQLVFKEIRAIEFCARFFRETTCIVTGRTEMTGKYAGTAFLASSRYTHVYIHDATGWRLASAQGTPAP